MKTKRNEKLKNDEKLENEKDENEKLSHWSKYWIKDEDSLPKQCWILGDIVLTQQQIEEIENEQKKVEKRQAIKDASYPDTRWPRKIPYYFDEKISKITNYRSF